MDYLVKIINNIWVKRFLSTFIVILISSIIYHIFSNFVNSSIDKNTKFLTSNKSKTYIKMLRSIIRYIIIIIDMLIILQIFGINITSMIAGVGIISIIIGFAIQDALKDIIKGIDIISDNYYNVGDVIKYNNVIGKVIAVGLKTTKIEDVETMNLISISNRNIEFVEVVSNVINIDIPIGYDVNINVAEKVIESIITNLKKEKKIINAEYKGISDFADSSLKYRIKVYCKPINKVQVRIDSLTKILRVLTDNNISIPFNQIDVHYKNN